MVALLGLILMLVQQQAPALAYRAVAGWPQVPAGWTLGQGSGVAVDAHGRLWALHRGSRPVLCFDRDGRLVHSWGNRLFTWPHGIRIDSAGNVWITDGGTGWWPTPNPIPGRGHVVLKFSPEGKLLLTLGIQGEPGEDERHFNGPSDVAFAPDGSFFVTDGYGNSRVVKFSKDGKYLLAWGKKGSAPGEFNLPHAIAVDPKGRLYVADRENLRLQIFDFDGRFLAEWKHVGRPIGLTLAADGTLFVADANRQAIIQVDATGKILGEFGTRGDSPGQLSGVHQIAVGSGLEIFTAELGARRFQRFRRMSD